MGQWVSWFSGKKSKGEGPNGRGDAAGQGQANDQAAKQNGSRNDTQKTPAQQSLSIEWTGENKVVIIVMGATGSGKSTFVNRASGQMVASVGDGLKSCTNDVQSVDFLDQESGRSIVLVDTPGFNKISQSDFDVLDKLRLSGWLDNSHKKGRCLSVILYLHRITDNRMEGMPSPPVFRKLCGSDALHKVYFATTMWDDLGQNEPGEERMNELRSESWKIARGSHVLRTPGRSMNADDISAKEVIREILEDLNRTTASGMTDSVAKTEGTAITPSGAETTQNANGNPARRPQRW